MSRITGAVIDLGAEWAVNSTLKFTYRSSPAVASGALVHSKTPKTAKVTNEGTFSTVLPMGNYDVTIDDGPDRWIISVPDDTASYDIVGRITGSYTQNPTLPLVGSVPNASNTVAGIVKLMRNAASGLAFVPTGIWTVDNVTTLKAVVTDLTAHVFAVLLQPTGNMGVFYRWDAASTAADDAVNYLVIRPTDIGAPNPGRWLKMTIPVNAGGTGGTTAATARTALGVPNIDDAYGMVNTRASRGGLWIENSASYKATGGTGMPHGVADFSLFAVVQMRDWSNAANPVIIASHSTGNNRWLFRISAAGAILLQIIDGAGAIGSYTLTPDVAFVDGEIYSIGVAIDRDANATAYINALSDRDFNGTGVTTSVAASVAVDIGNGNVNPIGFGLGMDGIIYAARVFNELLTANDFFLMHKRGAPTWESAAGSLSKYVSDFSAGADGWTAVGTAVLTGNTDAIGGVDDTLLVNSNAGTLAGAQKTLQLVRKKGQRIKVTFDIYIPNTNATGVTARIFNDLGVGAGFSLRSPVANTWNTYSEEVIIASTGAFDEIVALRVYLLTAAGASSVVTAGDKYYIKNFRIEYPGCCGDWDCEYADPMLSTTLLDRTGNTNLTTIAGTYQVRPQRQFAVEKLIVGAGAAGAGTPITRIFKATATLDFPSVAATGGQQTLTIAVPGAQVGDTVSLALPAAPTAGVTFFAWVSVAGTVSVRVTNPTGGAIDPASASYTVITMG